MCVGLRLSPNPSYGFDSINDKNVSDGVANPRRASVQTYWRIILTIEMLGNGKAVAQPAQLIANS
jgi:hypothetical protein